jgi:hypothetical protein
VSQPLGHALLLIALGPASIVSNQFNSQGIYKGEPLSTRAGAVLVLNLGLSKDLINILIRLATGATSAQQPCWLLWGQFTITSPGIAHAAVSLWKVMYTANQTTLDMRSFDRDLAISSQMIYSLDDISFVNNQSECAGLVAALPQAPTTFDMVLVNTFLIAPSVRCNDNRFTDGFTLTLLSLLSLSLPEYCGKQPIYTLCCCTHSGSSVESSSTLRLNNAACRALATEFNLSRHETQTQ